MYSALILSRASAVQAGMVLQVALFVDADAEGIEAD